MASEGRDRLEARPGPATTDMAGGAGGAVGRTAPVAQADTEPARRIMSTDEVRRAIVRIGHEVVEKHGRPQGLALVGIERRGALLARRVADAIEAIHGVRLPTSSLDITPYRDDRPSGAPAATPTTATPTPLPFAIEATTIVLVDDVLFTGRTIRAALQALTAFGRPAAVRVAVLVDRGHRELPIRADHVGRNIPTARSEDVQVRLNELDGGEDEVIVSGSGT